MTGSDKTFEQLIFGAGDAGAQRKAEGRRILDKPITAELGNVSPVIIVPGNWTDAEINYQAEHLATTLSHNAGSTA